MGLIRWPAHQVTPPAADTDTYVDLLDRLRPPGRAWTGTRWGLVLRGLAAELVRLHNRGRDLLDEADPRTTSEMLEAWERVADLDGTGTESERQAALWAQVTAYGGQTAAYLEEMAGRAGFTVTIESGNSMGMQPFKVGSSGCDAPIRGVAWAWAFVVHASSALTTAQKATLVALITRLKPVHAAPHYLYDL